MIKMHELKRRERDTGLQPQRTILSWFRTIAVIFLNALLLMKIGMKQSNAPLIGLGIIILLLAMLMYAYSLQRNQIMNYDIEIVTNRALLIHQATSVTLALTSLCLFLYFIQPLFILIIG